MYCRQRHPLYYGGQILELLFAPLHRSSPSIGGLRYQAIQTEHGPYKTERTQKAVYIVKCLWEHPTKFVLPPAEKETGNSNASCTDGQLKAILTTMAGGGRAKLSTPAWPKLSDTVCIANSFPLGRSWRGIWKIMGRANQRGPWLSKLKWTASLKTVGRLCGMGEQHRRPSWRRWRDCLGGHQDSSRLWWSLPYGKVWRMELMYC
jgi:hypothetical protein